MKTLGICIPTYQSKRQLSSCLKPLLRSSLQPRILVIDSSSSDGTLKLAESMGVETLSIPQAEFNHGRTRERGRKLLGTSIVAYLTPDALLAKPEMLETLCVPLLEEKTSIAYARQIPHEGADFFEAFPREFNYPEEGHTRGWEDASRYGAYTFFCSDSCAAYVSSALDEVGGFPSTFFGEDTLVTAQLLRKGHRIAYVAEAVVRHSHRYTLKQEWQRHFDIGLFRKKHQKLLASGPGVHARGGHYARQMLSRVTKERPLSLPYACLHLAAKYVGYCLGALSMNAPLWWKRLCSSQKYHWKRP